MRHILREIITWPQVRRPVTHRLLEEVQAEDEEHAEALLTLLINTSRFPAASERHRRRFAVRIEDTSFVNRKSIELNPHVWVVIPKN
jgi:hypothetical protein